MVEDEYELEIKPQFQLSLKAILEYIKGQSYQQYEKLERYCTPYC